MTPSPIVFPADTDKQWSVSANNHEFKILAA